MKTLSQQFRNSVEGFLQRTGTKPSEFGRQATGDPSLVLSLRRGRSPTLATADKVLAYIQAQERTAIGATIEDAGDHIQGVGP